MQELTELTELISSLVELHPIAKNIISSIITFFIIWLLRSLLLKAAFRQIVDPKERYQWRKTTGYIATIFIVLFVGRVWLEGVQSITNFLGLLSAGVAIALKDPLINLASWGFIMWHKPFEVGDRIQIGNYSGDVIDIHLFQFTLIEIGNWVDADQSTGRIVHIPNGKIFTETQANYSKGFNYIWNEIPVLVTFESDWEKAKEILGEIAEKRAEHLSASAKKAISEASRQYMILYSKLTPAIYTSVKDCGVLLTIRYLCEPRHRRDTSQSIWEDILREFAKYPNIDFAYPTQRFFNNSLESKQATQLINQIDTNKPILEKVVVKNN